MSKNKNMRRIIADFVEEKDAVTITELSDYLEFKFNRKFSKSYLSNLITDLVDWGILKKEIIPKKNPEKRGGKTYDTFLFFYHDEGIVIDEGEDQIITLNLTNYDGFKNIIEQLITVEQLQEQILANDVLRKKFHPHDRKFKDRRSNKNRSEALARELLKIVRETLLDNFNEFYR